MLSKIIYFLLFTCLSLFKDCKWLDSSLMASCRGRQRVDHLFLFHTWQENGISQWKVLYKTARRDLIAPDSLSGLCFDSCSQREGVVCVMYSLPTLLMEYQRQWK